MLQNVQSVTTFPLPPSKIPDFIGTTAEHFRELSIVEKRTGAAIDLCNA